MPARRLIVPAGLHGARRRIQIVSCAADGLLASLHDAIAGKVVPASLDLLPACSHGAVTREVVPLAIESLPIRMHIALGVEVVFLSLDGHPFVGWPGFASLRGFSAGTVGEPPFATRLLPGARHSRSFVGGLSRRWRNAWVG